MKHDLKQLLDQTLNAYPELLSKDIRICWKKLSDAIMEIQEYNQDGWEIEVDKTLENAPQDVLIGGIAHELSHITTTLKLSKLQKLRDLILYKVSIRYRTLDERNTDLDAIIRGFGPQLLAFLHETESQGYDYFEDEGLSIREIKKLTHLSPKRK